MPAVKALLLENVHPDAERILTERGYEVEVQSEALPPEALSAALEGVSLLGIRSATHVTAEVIAATAADMLTATVNTYETSKGAAATSDGIMPRFSRATI